MVYLHKFNIICFFSYKKVSSGKILKMNRRGIQTNKFGLDIIVDDIYLEETNVKLDITNQISETYSKQKYSSIDIYNNFENDGNNKSNKFKCKKNQKLFSNKPNLDSHLENQYSIKQSYTCSICQKLFHCKYRYNIHLQNHNDNTLKYKCKVCGKLFTRKYHIMVHNRTHTGEKPYKCDQCGKLFSMKHNLLFHIRTHTGEKPFTCALCNESFIRKDVLSKHIQTHRDVQLLTCVNCQKQFSVKTYTGEKHNIMCKLCLQNRPEPYTSNNDSNTNLKQDIFSRTCSDDKVCVEIDVIGIKNENNLQNCYNEHYILTPTLDILPTNQITNMAGEFQSDVKCIETFCSVELKENPYKCYICQQLFSNKQTLNSHTRSHTTEQPYKCTICKKSFIYKYQIDAHILDHKMDKYKCKVCGKCFTRMSHFNTHSRIHTGDKRFKCEMCPKLFLLKHHLLNHIRTHTKEKPFSCELCNASFCRKDVLNNHKWIHIRKNNL